MGKELVRRQGIAVLALLTLACPKQQAPVATSAAREPLMRATVVTMQTTMQPDNKALLHRIVIAGSKARAMNELDAWRLIDLKTNTITFVDDVAKTYRTESIASLVTKRRAAHNVPLAETIPRATYTPTTNERTLLGTATRQSIIRAGAYQRELWIGTHPSIPDNLFAVMYGTDTRTPPTAPMMKAVDDALVTVRGFPFADHAELPLEKSKMVVERIVTKIEEGQVPASLLAIPKGYRDLTPK
jgi:hypothetical protein